MSIVCSIKFNMAETTRLETDINIIYSLGSDMTEVNKKQDID